MHVLRLSLCWLVVGAVALGAQAPAKPIPDDVSCARCAIASQPLLSIGAVDGPGSLAGSRPTVRVDGRGRFWLFHEGELPMVFDATGKFMQIVGRKGQGPGEFTSPFDISFLPGDSALVYDYNRASVIDPNLKFVRSVATPQPLRGLVVKWPSVVMGANDRVRKPGDEALLRLNFAGNPAAIDARFGPLPDSPSPNAGRVHLLSSSRNAHFWAVSAGRYWIGQWSADGVMKMVVDRRAALFINPPYVDGGQFSALARPSVAAIREDSSGLLWVAISVARPGWREGIPTLGPGVIEIAARSISYEKIYHTVIEIIDPLRGTVVARKDLNEWIVALLPDGRVASYDVDIAGTPKISISRLLLQGR